MADQQFCLRWNNHQSTLISVFDTLLENGTLVDCTLAAEGQYLKAHKVVLSACSPYLETLLSQHYEKHPIVILKDVKFSELKSMMDYMYRGEVNISQDQLGTFLKAAESLQIKGLSDNGADGDARDVGSTAKATPARKTTQPAQPLSRPSEPQRPDLPESPAHRDDGTISPSSRKKRRIRRGSQGDDSSLGDSHLETSNSCDAQSTPIVPNIPASSSITATPIKAPIVKPEQTELVNRIDTNSLPPESGLLKEKIEPSEPLLEPKTEYLDDMNNDDSVEDLTLDDDDEMDGMDVSNMSNMSNMSRPGPSHGNDISQLSNQGFNPWQLGGNQTGTDEVFMAAQEAVGAHRDSQDIVMNGEGTNGDNSNPGKDSSEGNHSNDYRSEGNHENKKSGAAADDNSSAKDGGPSSGSGGDDDKPPSKPDKNPEVEDEKEEEDDDNDPDEDHKPSKEELNTYRKRSGNLNGDTEDFKLNFADQLEAGFDLPKPKRGRPVGSGRGRRGRKKSFNMGDRDSLMKGPRKQRNRREFTPSEMVRRERKIKEKKTETEDKIALARKKYLMSIAVKEEDTSSWDREVATTLKSVIQKSKRAKKYRAVGRPRKIPLEDGDGCGRKIKKEVAAYPIIAVKKGKESGWNTEAKYTIPGFCCNDCGAVYQSTAALRRHQNYECGKEPQFKCNECDYAAKHKGTLKSHIKNRHLPKGALDETPKKPRKPRRPRVTFIPPSVPSPS